MSPLQIMDSLGDTALGSLLPSRDSSEVAQALEQLVGENAAQSVLLWAGHVGLHHMSVAELVTTTGVDVSLAARIIASRRLWSVLQDYEEPEVTCSKDVVRALPVELRHLEQEVILGCALNARARMTALVLLARGGAGQTALTPRDVFVPMVRLGARAMVLVHNHPSRSKDPSDDDVRFTRHVFSIGRTLGIQLLDHLVVGGREVFSFADAGLLPEPESLDDFFDNSDG